MKTILRFILSSPKTYLPLLIIIITWGMGAIGIEVDEQVKESITVICGAIAAWLLRRGMVKEKEMSVIIDKKVEEHVERVLQTKPEIPRANIGK